MWLAIFAGHIAFEIHETPRVNISAYCYKLTVNSLCVIPIARGCASGAVGIGRRRHQVRLLCLEGTDRCLSWEEFHFKKH
jgi:hypothetical protein